MSTRYLNGAEYKIDLAPGNLNVEQLERDIRTMKANNSKVPVFICHLERLIEVYRKYTNQPKQDWRRTIGG